MTTRIICIGDSITRGTVRNADGTWPNPCYPSYRWPLWQRLVEGNHDATYVGPWTAPDYPPSMFNFPQNNAAKNDNTTKNASDRAPAWPVADVAICVLGTEDAFNQTPLQTRIDYYLRLIDALRSANPAIRIVIAKIPPTDNDFRNATQVTPFNTALSQVAARGTTASPVAVVDLWTGFSKSWLQDARNPNGTGDTWIAGKVYDAIRAWLIGTTELPVAPVAAFVGAPLAGPAPLTVQFTNQTTAAGCAWSWSFGDGATSTEQSPSHEYAAAGTYTVALTATNAGGTNTLTRTGYVTVAAAPGAMTVDFEYAPDPPSGTVPFVVTFQDASDPAATACAWDFGDGYAGAGLTVSHTYRSPGTYTVALQASRGALSGTETKTDLVAAAPPDAVPALPEADFSIDPASGTAPFTVQFHDLSGGVPTSWLWDFGDGGAASVANPVHQYTAAGTYDVTLSVANAFGTDAITKADAVTVAAPAPVALQAAFTALETASAYIPFLVHFRDDSAGAPIAWSWSFGDGETSTEQHPAHAYTSPGIYSVTLAVEDLAGAVSAITRTDYISVGGDVIPLDPLPRADFLAAPIRVAAGSPVRFADWSDLRGVPLLRSGWAFGDGATGLGDAVLHTYAAPGTYTVIHGAETQYGLGIVTRENAITVTDGEPAPVALHAAIAIANLCPTTGQAPLPVRFRDASAGSPVGWHWDFGDGATSDEQNPVHVYLVPGQYRVTLTVRRPPGFPPVPGAEPSKPLQVFPGCAALPRDLDGDGLYEDINGNGTLDFADPITLLNNLDWAIANQPVECFDFSGSGTLDYADAILLYQFIETGVFDTWERSVAAFEFVVVTAASGAPVTAFTVLTPSGTVPLSVAFHDDSGNAPTAWEWSFGDGGTSTLQHPTHTYTDPGTFDVTLAASNAIGKSTLTKVGAVIASAASTVPTVAFSTPVTEGIAPLLVPFVDASTNAPTAWSWSFGDGATDTDRHPLHVYQEPGVYDVALTATNSAGSATLTKADFVTVLPAPAPLGGVDPTHEGIMDLLAFVAATWVYAEVHDGAGHPMRTRFSVPAGAWALAPDQHAAVLTLTLRGSDLAESAPRPFVPALVQLFEGASGGSAVWDTGIDCADGLSRAEDEIDAILTIPIEDATTLVRIEGLAFSPEVPWGSPLDVVFSVAGGSAEQVRIDDVRIETPEVAYGGHLLVSFVVNRGP